MSLFGALFTGTSSLAAQSQNAAMISNNIANVSTTGFKRSEAFFDSLVTSQSRLSRFSPGTVSVSRVQRVNEQGPIQQTSSATDAAISGNGLFPVKRSNDFGQEFLYTRSGSFSEDAQGLLRNTAGFVLYAWPIDANGNLPADQGDLASLVPADVAFLGGLTRPTTTAELAINVDASQGAYNTGTLVQTAAGPPAVYAQTGTTSYTGFPIPSTRPANFSRGLTVYDELGASETLTLEFRKSDGPEANTRTESTLVLDRDTVLTTVPGLLAGQRFSIQTTGMGAPQVYSIAAAFAGAQRVDTVGDLIDHVNETLGGGDQVKASLTSDGQLLFQAKELADTLTFTETNGTPLFSGTGFNLPNPTGGVTETFRPFLLDGLSAQSVDNPYGYDDSTLSNNQGDFPQLQNSTTPNPAGWWELKIVHPDGSIISQGLLNYNGDGTLNATGDASGNIDIELSSIDWGNGSSPQDIKVDIQRFSQFSGNFDVIFSDQNGAELGLRTGVELTRDGIVVARFSNGASADLYQIPLVTFANENGLQEVSGTAYTKTEESGEENLREAGSGGSGFVEPSTLETSNVDIADEFAKLIVSQRTFTASTRVINTVDQMTEDLIRLR